MHRVPAPKRKAGPGEAQSEEQESNSTPGSKTPIGSGQMPGDWTCPSCGDNVFARNMACRQCGTQKPGAAGGKGGKGGNTALAGALAVIQALTQTGALNLGGVLGAKGGGKGKSDCKWCAKGECWTHKGASFGGSAGKGGAQTMAGDWLCPGCGDHQFARNETCKQCQTPKPADGTGILAKASYSKMMPGDWICPSCGDHQFGKNDACKQCSEPKPAGAGAMKGRGKQPY